jgi:hypothetical protein
MSSLKAHILSAKSGEFKADSGEMVSYSSVEFVLFTNEGYSKSVAKFKMTPAQVQVFKELLFKKKEIQLEFEIEVNGRYANYIYTSHKVL